MSGKGSNRRPQQVSREEYERRWAETFNGADEEEVSAAIDALIASAGSGPVAQADGHPGETGTPERGA